MPQKVLYILLVSFIVANYSILKGLDPSRSIDEYNVEIYTTENGLPQSSVLSIIQTTDGYLWLGTYEGLARFDGIRFRVFDSSNTSEIASNRIKSLFEDSKGNLWIGTSGGLLCYRNGAFKNYTTKNKLSNNFVVCLCEDRLGRIWVGTTNGLNRWENGVFTSYNTKRNKLTGSYISALCEDNEGNLWIGTSGDGLHKIDIHDERITPCIIEGCSGNIDIRTLYKDRQGRIWIGTAGRGIAVTKGGDLKRYTHKSGLSGDDVRAIFQDSNGTLWVGTNGQGLNTFKESGSVFSNSHQGLFGSPIRSIFEDREGNIWIGTRDGLSQLKNDKFIIYNNRNGLPVDSVRTIFQDAIGNIWIGTVNGGLVQFNGNRFKTYGVTQGLKSEHIWAIAQSSDSSLWFGTYGGGLHRLKNGKIINIYTTRSGLSNNIIRAIFVDARDNVWVGTNGGGVDIIQKDRNYKTISNYSTKSGLSNDFIYAIAGDSKGNIWIGTYSGDINCIYNGNITVYSVKEGLTGHAIWCIYPDEDDTLWIGTDGGGLVRFKNKSLTRFTIKDGLYSDLAFQVFEDKNENLWMNCNKGIYTVRRKDLEDFSTGVFRPILYQSFGKEEGIKSTECAGPAQPAGICTREGKLWFPTIKGALVINPRNNKINETVPPVIIEEIRADGELIYSYPDQEKKGLILAAGKKRLDFKYTGLSFTASHQVKFKYKLAGFDEEWMEVGTERRVSYTNITPGNYTFQVICCNNDGVWNNQGESFSFTLKPFFWQTWWFRILFLITFGFLFYIMINFIKSHLKLIAFWKKKKYIGSYEIDEQIGAGGMGIVYKVHSLIDRSKTFALKVMKEEYLLDEVQKKRFKNESLLVDSLDHPHIVKVYERGQQGEMLYIVMELLEGESLAQRYKKDEFPSVTQCIHIISQMAYILENLHRERIIHRDLKPENIMLIYKDGDPDYVKLLDFGIARVQSFSHLTESGQVLGTIPYLPPEVIADGKPTPAVDIYSLGVIAYEMLTGRKPFTGVSPIDTMKKILNDAPRPPKELAPVIPSRLSELILKMIEKNADNRPDARGILAILDTIQ